MMSSERNNSSSASYEVGGKSSSIKKVKSSNEKRKCGRSDPIDESEQEKIVSKLRQDAERQANTGRTTTFYLFRTIAGLFTAAMFYTIAYPYEIDHQVQK